MLLERVRTPETYPDGFPVIDRCPVCHVVLTSIDPHPGCCGGFGYQVIPYPGINPDTGQRYAIDPETGEIEKCTMCGQEGHADCGYCARCHDHAMLTRDPDDLEAEPLTTCCSCRLLPLDVEPFE